MKKLVATNQQMEQQYHQTVCLQCDHNHAVDGNCWSEDKPFDSAQEDQEGKDLISQTLGGKYRIEERIGAGGMCLVYRATQTLIGKIVAVKVLRPRLAQDQQIVRRFEQEARTVGGLRHPHAINVFDFGSTEEGYPFLVMDFINGQTLTQLLRQEGSLPIPRTNRLLGQICGALQAAHEAGIVHRDIKPANILISEADGDDWVTVVDFGVAQIQQDNTPKASLTREGVIIGTPRYMSPEQSEGKAIDARSDIYSLGILLYEMLVGEAPFDDKSSTRVLIRHITESPQPLRVRQPEIPIEVEAVVMRALSKYPSERPSSALALSEAFAQASSTILPGVPGAPASAKIIVPLRSSAATDVTRFGEEEEATMLGSLSWNQASSAVLSVTGKMQRWVSSQPRKALAIAALGLTFAAGVLFFNRRTEAELAPPTVTLQASTASNTSPTRNNDLEKGPALPVETGRAKNEGLVSEETEKQGVPSRDDPDLQSAKGRGKGKKRAKGPGKITKVFRKMFGLRTR